MRGSRFPSSSRESWRDAAGSRREDCAASGDTTDDAPKRATLPARTRRPARRMVALNETELSATERAELRQALENSQHLNRMDQSHQCEEAPTYYPTTEQFEDPIACATSSLPPTPLIAEKCMMSRDSTPRLTLIHSRPAGVPLAQVCGSYPARCPTVRCLQDRPAPGVARWLLFHFARLFFRASADAPP